MPEPQPISRGNNSRGIPERSTNRIPGSAARLDVRGRRPFGLARLGGSSGAISPHRPSGRGGLAISTQRAKPRFVSGSKTPALSACEQIQVGDRSVYFLPLLLFCNERTAGLSHRLESLIARYGLNDFVVIPRVFRLSRLFYLYQIHIMNQTAVLS